MSRNRARPLSPHLSIWRWGPHMAVSIFHRATGTALAVGGGVLLVWWLAAAASGQDSYARFVDLMTSNASGRLNWLPALVLIGLSWGFFQHLASGVRHLLLDTGAGYELKANKAGALATFLFSFIATVLFWAALLARS